MDATKMNRIRCDAILSELTEDAQAVEDEDRKKHT